MIKYDVFISYSRKDYVDEHENVIPGNAVSLIMERLTAEGISYWFDKDGVYSGDNFIEKIVANIEASSIFIYLSTANANSSKWTCKEIACADEFGKKIIPVRIDKTPYNKKVTFRIADNTFIRYYANPEQGLNDLVVSIKTYLAKLKEKEEEEKKRKEKEKEAEHQKEEERKRQKELEMQQQKAEQQRLIKDIKIDLKTLNNEETKLEADRSTLLAKAEKITDTQEKETIVKQIIESSPIRKKLQKDNEVYEDIIKELDIKIKTLTQINEGLDSKNSQLLSKIKELESNTSFSDEELNEQLQAKDSSINYYKEQYRSQQKLVEQFKKESSQYKNWWLYRRGICKKAQKTSWSFGILIILLMGFSVFFWLHGNIKFAVNNEIKPTPKTFLNKQANQENVISSIKELVNTGNNYYHGLNGMPLNYEKALFYYRKAAELGSSTAETNIGLMYQNGNGVQQDYKEAFNWYRKAARHGNADGQYHLGYMYQFGYGVKQSYKNAIKWYKKAAEQGHNFARIQLKTLE